MRHAGIRHARDVVHIGQAALCELLPRHDVAVMVAHDLDVHALVIRVGVSVVRPEEAADLHLLARGRDGLVAVSRQRHDLARAELVGVLIAELVIGKRFKRDAQTAVRMLADQNGQPSQLVAGGQNAVRRHQQDRDGAADHLLRVQNALHEVFLHVDEGGDQLRDVDLAAALRHELVSVVGEVGVDQLVDIVDDAYRADGIQPEV